MRDSLIHNDVEVYEGLYSLSMRIKKSDDFSWWISGISGIASRRQRKNFWVELDSLINLYNTRWILGGDFDVYRWAHETTSSRPSRYNMRKFNSFANKANLMEPNLSNGVYTWSNLRNTLALSKLDRFLYNS